MEMGNAEQLGIKHIRSAIEKTIKLKTSGAFSSQIADLSIMELCLLIASKHLYEIFEGEPFGFDTVFQEYLKFRTRKMPCLPKDRGIVFKAWQTLVGLK